MDIEGLEDASEQGNTNEDNPLMQIALAMQRLKAMNEALEDRIKNVEVYLGEMSKAASDEESLVEFLQETHEKAEALSAKTDDGANGETETPDGADKADGTDSADINTML